MSAELLKVNGLSYRRNKKAPYSFENINFIVKNSEKLVIYGGIATGKTALFEVITGVKHQNTGQVELVGEFAVVTQKFNLYSDLTVGENLEFTCEINNYSKVKMAKIIASTGLIGWEKVRAEKLPLGLKKMLQIACAIARDYQLLILDEVTVGLDQNLTKKLWEILDKLVHQGKGVLLFTALAGDLEHSNQVLYLNEELKHYQVDHGMELFPQIEPMVVKK